MKFLMRENGFKTETEYGTLNISKEEEFGFRPFQLLLSGIAGCCAETLRLVLDKMRIPYDDIQLELNVTRNEEEANRVTDVHILITLSGENISLEKTKKALEVSNKNCGIIRSVEDSINITKEIEVKSQYK